LRSHEIDYRIVGDDIQFVVLGLDQDETVIAEAGSFMMMDEGIHMDTVFGDASDENKGFGSKLLSAGKRLITGESLFVTTFTNQLEELKKVAFAAPYPGKILPLDLSEYDEKIICQRDSFLCAAKGVTVGVELTKKLRAGFFAGESFVLQRLEGDGLAFIHAGGAVIKRELKPGEVLKIDTGCLVAMTQDVEYSIEMVSGIKSIAFSGNGLFNTTLTGPGTVWVQSMPFSRLASRIYAAAPQSSSSSGDKGILNELLD